MRLPRVTQGSTRARMPGSNTIGTLTKGVVVLPGVEGPLRWFARHRSLGPDDFALCGLVAAFDGAEVDVGVLPTGLSGEHCWSPHVPSEKHVDFVVWALRDLSIFALNPEEPVDILHYHGRSFG